MNITDLRTHKFSVPTDQEIRDPSTGELLCSTSKPWLFLEIETDGGFFIDDWITGNDVLTPPLVGDIYCAITGIVSYSFGNYRINPRTAADLVPCTSSGPPPAPGQ